MNEPKIWWQSKTLWFNTLAVVVFAAQLLLKTTTDLQLSPEILTVLGIVVGVGNYILRFQTNQPITLKREETSDGG